MTTEPLVTPATQIRAHLLANPKATVPQIAQATGLARHRCYTMVRSMVRRGMLGDSYNPEGILVYEVLREPVAKLSAEQLRANQRIRERRSRGKVSVKRKAQRAAARALLPPRPRKPAKVPGVAVAAYRARQAAAKAARLVQFELDRRHRTEKPRHASVSRSAVEQPKVGCVRPERCAKPVQSYDDWLAQGNKPEVLAGPGSSIPRQIPVRM